MKSMVGVILTGGKNNRLKDLSDTRTSSAIPVGGKYRAIDFVLSNMVNSGINHVALITQYSFRSLMDHLGSGKEWDLDRRNGGLFIFPPYLSGSNSDWYKGSADAMYNNITFLKRSYEEYVVIAQGNCVYKMDYSNMLDYHEQKGADITIAYRNMGDLPADEIAHMGVLEVSPEGQVKDFEEKPLQPKTKDCSIGIYIMRRTLLISLLEECIAHGNYDFVKDVLIKKVPELKIYGYEFNDYWRSFSSINGYYRCNMEILNPEIQHKLFVENGNVYTKVKDEPPAKYNDEADVKNSIVADGCIIEGKVINSVLFRGVTVKKGAVIKDCIVMQGSVIEENADLQYMILDKNVIVTQGVQLKGASGWPVIIGKEVKV